MTANTLMAATWSTILAVGAAAGGFATDLLGEHAVFVIDSLSYLVSGVFVARAVIPQDTDPVEHKTGILKQAVEDIKDGYRHLKYFPAVGRIVLAKGVWVMGGGGLVFMLAMLGGDLMPDAQAIGIGVLFSVRGLGTGIGPILARRWFVDQTAWPAVLGWCIALSGVFYLAVAFSPWTSIVFVSILIATAHATSGANWVLSNVLLQQRTVDRFRGRVFATELLLFTVIDALSIIAASVLLESGILDLRGGMILFGGIMLTAGIVWLFTIVPAERAYISK